MNPPDSPNENEELPENPTDEPASSHDAPITVVILATSSKAELDALLAPIGPQPDVTFIVTFALDGESTAGLPELEPSNAGMPITIAKPGTQLAPGAVFVIPPETPLGLAHATPSVHSPRHHAARAVRERAD